MGRPCVRSHPGEVRLGPSAPVRATVVPVTLGRVTWLVTGAAGYIGSHVVRSLLAVGHGVLAVDDLSTGLPGRLPTAASLHVLDVRDTAGLVDLMEDARVAGVIHLAAKKSPAESMADPLLYYRENVGGLQSVLEAMRQTGVGRIVFSSSSSVYGTPSASPVPESATLAPINPYGATKAVGEQLVRDCAAAYGMNAVLLRYFNVAGAADPVLGDVGVHNLVPLALRAAAENRPPQVFGTDYPTPDGTCIRDYVHVQDLAEAHLAAATSLIEQSASRPRARAFNVGTGRGYSVLEVLDAVRDVTGTPYRPVAVDRRPGDPAEVVGDVVRAERELGWRARFGLMEVIRSAWDAWDVTARLTAT